MLQLGVYYSVDLLQIVVPGFSGHHINRDVSVKCGDVLCFI